MTPAEIMTRVRQEPSVRDMDATKYSDYDVLAALNTTCDEVYHALGTMSNELLDRRVVLSLEKENEDAPNEETAVYFAKLPADFLQVVSVLRNEDTALSPCLKTEGLTRTGYQITGDALYALSPSVVLVYRPAFLPLTLADMDADMELPRLFFHLVVKYTAGFLTGAMSEQDATVVAALVKDVRALVSGRGYSRLDAAPAWRV